MSQRIVIIDDEEDDLDIMKRYIGDAGFDVVFLAETGEEGLAAVKEHKPDIVVTDTNLPKIDGFEVCKRIKEMEGAEIKVIIMTGLIDVIDAGKARRAGADDYCVKTSDCEDIVDALKKLTH